MQWEAVVIYSTILQTTMAGKARLNIVILTASIANANLGLVSSGNASFTIRYCPTIMAA